MKMMSVIAVTPREGAADEITDLIRTYQRQSRRAMETDSK